MGIQNGLRISLILSGALLSTQVAGQDLSGFWAISEFTNGEACGEGNTTDNYIASVVQDGTDLTVVIRGYTDIIDLTGNPHSFNMQIPEDGGTTTAIGLLSFSGDSVSGGSNWTWSNGSESCSGTTTFTGNRLPEEAVASEAPLDSIKPAAPMVSYLIKDNQLTINWTATPGATGYTLYYAPYPSASPVSTLNLGTSTSITGELPNDAKFYIAVQAANDTGPSDISNIENFSMRSADIIEFDNQNSQVEAVLFGANDSKLVVFDITSTKTQSVFTSPDGKTALVTGDSEGRPTSMEVEGFTVSYTYGTNVMNITVRAPDGSETEFQEAIQSLTGQSQSALRLLPCEGPADCTMTGDLAPLLDDSTIARLETLVDDGILTFRRITSVPFCAQPVGIPTCKAIEYFAENGPGLKDRLIDRANYLTEKLSNAVNCATSLDLKECGIVIAERAQDLSREVSRLGPDVPSAGQFEIGASGLTPSRDGWADYLANAGFTHTDVPCAESVFAHLRPECGGSSSGTPPTTPPATLPATPPAGSAAIDPRYGCGGLTEYSLGAFRGCKDAAGKLQGQYLEYYSNGNIKRQTSYVDGLIHGITKSYQTNGKLLVESTWSANKLSGTARTFYSDGTVSSEGQFVNNRKEGAWSIYSANGTKTVETFSGGNLVSSSNSTQTTNSNASRWGCPITGCPSTTSGGSSSGGGSSGGSSGGGSSSNDSNILSCSRSDICAEYEIPDSRKFAQFAKQCRAAGSRVTEGARACPSAPNCTHSGNGMVQTTFAFNKSAAEVQSACRSTNGRFASQ